MLIEDFIWGTKDLNFAGNKIEDSNLLNKVSDLPFKTLRMTTSAINRNN